MMLCSRCGIACEDFGAGAEDDVGTFILCAECRDASRCECSHEKKDHEYGHCGRCECPSFFEDTMEG